MDDAENFRGGTQVDGEWLLDSNQYAQHNLDDENQWMMDYIVSNSSKAPNTPKTPSKLNSLPSSSAKKTPNLGNFFNPSTSTPRQHDSNLFNFSNISTPNNSRPTFFNPSTNMNASPQTPRPSFFNPSSGKVKPPPQSIFGPPLARPDEDVKDEVATQDLDDLFGPNIPVRAPVKSQAIESQPIPHSQQTSFTPNNEVNLNSHRTSAIEIPSTQQSNMSIDSDSNDDLMIIDEREASTEAKRKWQEPRPPTVIEDEGPIVKPESSADKSPTPVPAPVRRPQIPAHRQLTLPKLLPKAPEIPNMQDVLAVQRALLNKNKLSKDSATTNGMRAMEEVFPRINNKKRRRFGQIVEDDPEQVDAAMRAGSQEDDSWMHEEPEEDAYRERHELKKKIDKLGRKEANGKIIEAEMYELGRLRKQLRLKEKLLRCARGDPSRHPHEESLFVPGDKAEMLERKRREQLARQAAAASDDFDDERDSYETGDREGSHASDEALRHMLADELGGDGVEGVPTEKEITKPKKPRKKVAKNAREFFYQQEDECRKRERAKKQKKKAKGGRGRKPAGKGKGPAKKGRGAAKGKSDRAGAGLGGGVPQASHRFNQRSGVDEIGQMIINDLMNNDPILERLQNPIFDAGPEPEMTSPLTKTTQLQRLLANIPEGSSIKDAKNDKAKLHQASRSFGYAKVKAKDGKWLIKGMKSTLYHHQLLGAQWMIQRELSDEAPYGGLLADGMGLGKTVQTLACMVGNPPDEKDRSCHVNATLIVVPSSVIEQWLDEIRNHADFATFPKIMRYRASSKIPMLVLRDLDIVVTSYQEVMKQFPFPDQKDREQIAEIGYKKWWKKACKSMGDLFGVYWYRVVLDEAHAIKNNSARTSLACQNTRSALPLPSIPKANYSMDWKTFQKYFCDPDANDCHTRIATLLSYTMMRCTMKTTILNRATENRFRANLNSYFASGAASKNRAVFLVQLLCLRQCTSHPFMLERTIKESWTSSDLKELCKKLNSLGKMNIPFYEQCQVWVQQSEEAGERGEDIGRVGVDGCAPIEGARGEGGEAMPFGVGDYGHSFQIAKALKTLSEEDMYSRVTCSLCSDLPRLPMFTDCNHIFCKECITTYIHKKSALDNNDDYMTCPSCEKIFTSFQPYRGPQANDEDSMEIDSVEPENEGGSSGSSKGKKRKARYGSASKGADALGYEPKIADSSWVDKSDHKDFPLVPSAKTAVLKSILLKGFSDAPLDKVVIYVQFRLLAKIVARICEWENWGFLYLTGECSLEHRSKVVKTFRDDDSVKILIAGLKCGGLGLNFPWANRCISLDLWWNHAVEQQAFGRIFRIGQKKETYMTWIIVKNTVDMRLLTMQMHKLKACDTAMDSGEEKQKPSLSLRELAQLFGFLKTDADTGIISIEPDYEDDD